MNNDTQLAFDAGELGQWYDNDVEAMRELVGLVQHDLPRYVQTLESAADAGDLPAVARAAHTIKGAVSNVCARRLCRVSEEVEQSARAGDITRLEALRPEFRRSATELLSALEAWQQTLPLPTSSGSPQP